MKKASALALIFLCIILEGCSSSVNKTYFQFNKIEHFKIEIDEDKILNFGAKSKNTPKEKRLIQILLEENLDKLTDTTILKNLQNIGFQKKQIPQNKFEKIKGIFREKKHSEVTEMSCVAIYRDILIFKMNNKIVGTAKICFGCGQSIIAGSKYDTSEFGQSGDYELLRDLLYK
jgi:hypothetical protein